MQLLGRQGKKVKGSKTLSNGDWKYVTTKENRGDLGTRGIKAERLTRFRHEGPSWLGNEEDWPTQPLVVGTKDTQVKTLKIKDKLMVTIAAKDPSQSHFITNMISRFTYRKLLRITGWILRFKGNRLVSKSTGPLQGSSRRQHQVRITWIKSWIMINYGRSTGKFMDIHQFYHQELEISWKDFTWGSPSDNLWHTWGLLDSQIKKCREEYHL